MLANSIYIYHHFLKELSHVLEYLDLLQIIIKFILSLNSSKISSLVLYTQFPLLVDTSISSRLTTFSTSVQYTGQTHTLSRFGNKVFATVLFRLSKSTGGKKENNIFNAKIW